MIKLRPFAPAQASPAAWRALNAFRRVQAAEDDPCEPIMRDADFEDMVRRAWPFQIDQRICAWRGDEIVGLAGLGMRRPGTADYASFAPFIWIWGGVRQADRRRGIASRLMRAALGIMHAEGKTLASLTVHRPDAEAFLTRLGAVERHRAVENRMAFKGIDWAELAGWEQGVPADLNWEVHAGRVPVPRLATLMADFTALMQDAPRGKLEEPPHRAELLGYLSWYDDMNRHGGDHLLVLLTHQGATVAMCEASWDSRFPDRAFQALTAVARPWRGQGLAKAVKAAMLRVLHQRHPAIRRLITSNAEANAPMLAINTRLGFTLHRTERTFQIERATLDETLPQQAVRKLRAASKASATS